jgi:hypothetical protein
MEPFFQKENDSVVGPCKGFKTRKTKPDFITFPTGTIISQEKYCALFDRKAGSRHSEN